MKKLIQIFLFTVFTAPLFAQVNVDEWKVEQVQKLESIVNGQSRQLSAQAEVLDKTTAAMQTITERQTDAGINVDSLQFVIAQLSEAYKYFVENKEVIRTPIQSQDDANYLFAVLFGLLNMVLNAIALAYTPFRAWVDRYLSKSILAVATGVIFTAVAVILSKGETSILRIVLYLPIILGTHFGGFTLFRKTPQEKQTQTAA